MGRVGVLADRPLEFLGSSRDLAVKEDGRVLSLVVDAFLRLVNEMIEGQGLAISRSRLRVLRLLAVLLALSVVQALALGPSNRSWGLGLDQLLLHLRLVLRAVLLDRQGVSVIVLLLLVFANRCLRLVVEHRGLVSEFGVQDVLTALVLSHSQSSVPRVVSAEPQRFARGMLLAPAGSPQLFLALHILLLPQGLQERRLPAGLEGRTYVILLSRLGVLLQGRASACSVVGLRELLVGLEVVLRRLLQQLVLLL